MPKRHLPHNNRKFSALAILVAIKSGFWIITCFMFLVASANSLGYFASDSKGQSAVLGVENTSFNQLQHELAFWQSVVERLTSYRDAFIQASVLSYRLNQVEQARAYLNKALELDPNFKPAQDIGQLLNVTK